MAISVRVSENLEERLATLSKEAKISQSQIIRDALSAYIEDLEDYYIGVKAYKEFKMSGEKSIPAHELYKELGL